MLTQYNKKIDFDYPPPTESDIHRLKQQQNSVVLQADDYLHLENIYYCQQLDGTSAQMLTRASIAHKLPLLIDKLKPHYGLWIYDTYRSRATQSALFDSFYQDLQQQHPQWSQQQLLSECRQYVSHPTDKGHFAVPLHLSGGAIDLALFDVKNGKVLDFGSGFDEFRQHSHTAFYEQDFQPDFGVSEQQWLSYRRNRRILYHLMVEMGFVNFRHEWWHYDLGTCNWANELGLAYVYDEMS